jgi:hypothetical protein
MNESPRDQIIFEMAADDADKPTRIKEVVAREFRRVDPTAVVKFTEYFNHSFVPDIVVWWAPRTDHESKREVFLRPNLWSKSTADEVVRIATDDTTLYGLPSARPQDSDISPDALDAPLRRKAALAFEAGALSNIVMAGSEAVAGILASAIARTGIGSLDTASSTSLGELSSGSAGALAHGDVGQIDRLLKGARRVLRTESKEQFEALLQVLWRSYGNDASTFPAREVSLLGLSPQQRATLLVHLFAVSHEISPEVWLEVGSLITLAELEDLQSVRTTENLNSFVRNISGLLQVRSMAYQDQGVQLSMTADRSDGWRIEDGTLRAQLGRETLIFLHDRRRYRATKRRDHVPRWGQIRDAVPVDDLLTVTLDAVGPMRDAHISDSSLVKTVRLRARGPSAAEIDVDFERRLANAKSFVSLSEIARSALPLLAPNSSEPLLAHLVP